MLRLTGLILVFALGVGAAFALVSCGDDENPELLPGETAEQILDNLDTVAEAVDAGDCSGAEDAVNEIIGDIEDLDRPVSKELRQELKRGAVLLSERIDTDCTPEETAAPTTTAPIETTTHESTEETTTDKSTTTEETTAPEPTTTETTPPTTPTTPTTPAPPQPPPSGGGSSGGVGPGAAAG